MDPTPGAGAVMALPSVESPTETMLCEGLQSIQLRPGVVLVELPDLVLERVISFLSTHNQQQFGATSKWGLKSLASHVTSVSLGSLWGDGLQPTRVRSWGTCICSLSDPTAALTALLRRSPRLRILHVGHGCVGDAMIHVLLDCPNNVCTQVSTLTIGGFSEATCFSSYQAIRHVNVCDRFARFASALRGGALPCLRELDIKDEIYLRDVELICSALHDRASTGAHAVDTLRLRLASFKSVGQTLAQSCLHLKELDISIGPHNLTDADLNCFNEYLCGSSLSALRFRVKHNVRSSVPDGLSRLEDYLRELLVAVAGSSIANLEIDWASQNQRGLTLGFTAHGFSRIRTLTLRTGGVGDYGGSTESLVKALASNSETFPNLTHLGLDTRNVWTLLDALETRAWPSLQVLELLAVPVHEGGRPFDREWVQCFEASVHSMRGEAFHVKIPSLWSPPVLPIHPPRHSVLVEEPPVVPLPTPAPARLPVRAIPVLSMRPHDPQSRERPSLRGTNAPLGGVYGCARYDLKRSYLSYSC